MSPFPYHTTPLKYSDPLGLESWLTWDIYWHYFAPHHGNHGSAENPVGIPDDGGELKSAVSSRTDAWYRQFASSHGPGRYEVDENAAAGSPWKTDKKGVIL